MESKKLSIAWPTIPQRLYESLETEAAKPCQNGIAQPKIPASDPMATWICVKQCGACCHLDPSDRPDLADYLSPEELQLYLSLVGEDGWCVNFDPIERECHIYADRPRFCRVEPEIFQEMYAVEPEALNDFAIDCCRQQIEGVFGDRSLEMLRFERAIGL